MALPECPRCAAHLVRNPAWSEGALIDCPECGAALMIVSLDPLGVEEAPE